MLQCRGPCLALPNPHLLIFVDPEIGQQDAAEDHRSCQQEDLNAAPQAGAEANGRNHRGGQREFRWRVDLGWSEAPWAFRIHRYLRQVGGREYALAHFVSPPRALGQFQVVGDEDEAEGFRPLQLLEQIDDVGLGVLVEIAGRLVGEQQRRRIDERTGNRDAALLAAGHAAGIRIGAVRANRHARADRTRAHTPARHPWCGRAAPERRHCPPRSGSTAGSGTGR